MSLSQGDTSLQQQFQQLQQQQQQKLARRQTQKDNNKAKKNGADTKLERQSTFGVDDDLNLGAPGPSMQNSDYISEELVQHLNNQIRELKDETGRLYKCLSEKDYEIKHLNKKREEERLGSQSQVQVPSTEVAAMKIVELSKQIRELKAAYESEKTKGRQQAMKASQLERELKSQVSLAMTNDSTKDLREDKAPPGCVLESDYKSVCDKLRFAENRAAEVKMQQQEHKQQIQKLTKALSQEVGDGYNLQSILSNNSGWRGRQQLILLLQKKVNEMRTELNHYKLNQSDASLDDTGSLGSTTNRRNEESQMREKIRRQEKERKESLERSAAELKALETDYDDLKKKLDGSKARNKVLSTELKALKQQVSVMLDKGKNDDDLIKALMQQLETFKKLADDATGMHQKAIELSEKQMKEMSMKTQQDTNVTDQLKMILAQKDEKLHQIEKELERLKEENLQLNQRHTVSHLFADQNKNQDSDAEFSPDELDDPEMMMMGKDHHSDDESRNHGNDFDRHGNNGREISDVSVRESKAGTPSKRKNSGSKPRKTPSSQSNRQESANRDDKKVHFTPRESESGVELSTNVPRIDTDSPSPKKSPTPTGKTVGRSSKASDATITPKPNSGRRSSSDSKPPPSPSGRQSATDSYAKRHNAIRQLSAESSSSSRPSTAQRMEAAETEALRRAAEVERDRLNELVQSLQFRINEMTMQCTELSNELQNQKRRNVTLEKQMGKTKMEQTSLKGPPRRSSTGGTKLNRSQASLQNLEADLTDTDLMATEANLRDLQLSLALQQDENQALKSALQSTLLAKEEDLRLYQETISQTRKVFLHGIRNFKQGS